jgi:RND family efflux transporter MFP subunit
MYSVMKRRAFALMAAVAVLGCHGKQPPGAKPAPMPVQLAKLEPQRILDYDEYLASLTSRRSLDLYPQVSAYVSAVHVKPGDSVTKGRALIDLDPGQQTATLRSLQALLATKQASLEYAIQNDESSMRLASSGVLSELDYQQRHAQRAVGEADVQAARAQVDAQARLLGFYRIVAPSTGVVGDVPVKVGDYVTPQTELTSVDQSALIEVYVYIPIEKVAAMTPTTRIALFNQNGCQVCERPATFVSRQVDPSTQSLLVKTACPNSGELRESEVLKAHLIWSERTGLLVPTSAVARLAGQYFVWVAKPGPQGLSAERRPIRVGNIQGNEYVVLSGLGEGEQLVVSGLQKIRAGAPITAAPPGKGAAPTPSAHEPTPEATTPAPCSPPSPNPAPDGAKPAP